MNTINNSHSQKNNSNNGTIQLAPIELDDKFINNYRINNNDYLVICDMKGNRIGNGLYRKGGVFSEKSFSEGNYFSVLKYEHHEYTKEELETYKKLNCKLDRKYTLRSMWCIIDKYGNEKLISKDNHHIYNNSVLSSFDKYLYNIETNEKIIHFSNLMETNDYLFVHKLYDFVFYKTESNNELGVYQIDKKDGTIINFFKSK